MKFDELLHAMYLAGGLTARVLGLVRAGGRGLAASNLELRSRQRHVSAMPELST